MAGAPVKFVEDFAAALDIEFLGNVDEAAGIALLARRHATERIAKIVVGLRQAALARLRALLLGPLILQLGRALAQLLKRLCLWIDCPKHRMSRAGTVSRFATGPRIRGSWGCVIGPLMNVISVVNAAD